MKDRTTSSSSPQPACTRKPLSRKTARRGTAAAELAVCLPILVLVVMGSLECTGMLFVNQSLHIAAYEGARAAVEGDATNADVIARVNQVLSARNVNNAQITLSPADVNATAGGENVTITLSAPCEDNSIFPLWFFQGRTLFGHTTMVKE